MNTFEIVEGKKSPDITALSIHLGVYKNRPDVNSVMHTHARYSAVLCALAVSLMGISVSIVHNKNIEDLDRLI